MKTGTLPILALAVMAVTSAQARDDCDVPISNWKTHAAVRAMAGQRGWTLKRIKIDDGCYELQGTDKDGRRFEAKIDPVTLEVIQLDERPEDRRAPPPQR
ncbi:PepSY domain-containing protein [Rhizobium leguminosarum]|uniref:PepSY domain-containing protein n=1 Tax=Rhizobium leguminosarum TaxID=384 RepID=UPI001032135C|nr:PepSY domain-containing protein [Rhizobium leguminosarum]MBY5374095.1 PepSY domain-containing protein [Rhizobium leguminosarum]TBF94322.1 PepSY domain-containing protein [Rhizobium leguminosarum]